MARPLRIEYPGACYHVSNHGEDFDRIFPSARYCQAFLDCLGEAATRLNVQVYAYCLLKNSYHLLIGTPEGNLSRFMRQVDGMYTQLYQKLASTSGPVFRARYKSVLVQQDKYLLPVSVYVHNLPRLQRTSPAGYRWSSLGVYLNTAKAPAWLSRQAIVGSLPKGARAQARYRDVVAAGADGEIVHFYGKKNLLSILGDNTFRKRALAKQAPDQARGKSRGPQARLRPSITRVVGEVAGRFRVTEKSIYQAARGPGSKNLPRWIAMYLCQELSGVTLQDIARRFGLKRYGTVSTTIGKLKHEFARVPKLQAQVHSLRTKLAP